MVRVLLLFYSISLLSMEKADREEYIKSSLEYQLRGAILMRGTYYRSQEEKEGCLKVIEDVCSKVDLNNRNINGDTPLVCAVAHGDVAVVKIFLKHKADTNLAADGIAKVSPLKAAVYAIKNEQNCRKSHPWVYGKDFTERMKDITKLLCSSGAHVSEKDTDGRTIIDFAKMYDLHDYASFLGEFILECAICLDTPDIEWKTLACNHTFHTACLSGWISKVVPATCPLCRKNI